MKFSIKQGNASSFETDCLVLFLFENSILPDFTQHVDAHTEKTIQKLIASKELSGKAEEIFLLHAPKGIKAKRIIIAGLGEHEKVTSQILKKALVATIKKTPLQSIKTMAFCLTDLVFDQFIQEKNVQFAAMTLSTALFEFKQFKSASTNERALKEIIFLTPEKPSAAVTHALKTGIAIGEGQNYARILGNTPPNLCTPTFLSEEAQKLSKQHAALKCKVIDEKELEKMGAGAFVAVSKGSNENGKLVLLEYMKGSTEDKPIVLVGKGITFDTGGISLKSADKMHEMKYDMCGAASVLGVMHTITALQLPLNVIGVLACAENMPSGNASRPGDIIETLLGKTVEITNTDAEGRLVLCDAITYATKYQPAVMIDIATLTGACVVALGSAFSGLFCNDSALSQALMKASSEACDLVWPMPLAEEYMEALHSEHADFTNASDTRMGGAIVAGVFLSQFTKELNWAHLDIAGTAWSSSKGSLGATGRPVALLCHYLINYLHNAEKTNAQKNKTPPKKNSKEKKEKESPKKTSTKPGIN